MPAEKKNSFFIYDFLIHPHYRVGRHILFIVAMFLISLNSIHLTYGNYEFISAWQILIITLLLTGLYLAAVYINLYLLIPRFLYTKQYVKYISGIVLSALLLVILIDVQEYAVFSCLKLPLEESFAFHSDTALYVDLLFSSSLMIVCIIGSSSTALLRQWEINTRNIIQLKTDYLHSEIEELKDRVSPDFLFKILNRAGKMSVDNPEASSSLLVGLSRILRYQLYDCSREKVLLNADITFIRHYLNLHRSVHAGFEFNLTVEGNTSHAFVPPFLFLPLIQLLLNNNNEIGLDIRFILSGNMLDFMCVADRSTGNTRKTDMQKIHRRLKYIYDDSYRLLINDRNVLLHIQGLK